MKKLSVASLSVCCLLSLAASVAGENEYIILPSTINLAPEKSCGLKSLLALQRQLGLSEPSDKILKILSEFAGKEILSLAELQEAGAMIGLKLEGWELTLDEILERRVPAIVHSGREEGHFSVLLDSSNGLVRWLDGGSQLTFTDKLKFAEELSGYCLIVSDKKPERGPWLQFDQLDFDQGNVRIEDSKGLMTQMFVCQNKSNQKICFSFGWNSGCSFKIEGGAEILPSESRIITLEAKTILPTHWAEIITNDPEYPIQLLSFHQTPIIEPEVEPKEIHFSLQKGQKRTRQILMLVSPLLKVVEIHNDCPFLEVKPNRIITEHNPAMFNYLVYLKENAPLGLTQTEIMIETNDELHPFFNIPVTIEVRSSLALSLNRLFFSPKRNEELVLQITGYQKPDFRIEGVELDNNSLQTEVQSLDGAIAVKFTVSKEAAPEAISGTVWLKTNLEGEERIALPYYISSSKP